MWSDYNDRLGSTKIFKIDLERVCIEKTTDNTQILPKYMNQNKTRAKTPQNKETLEKAKKEVDKSAE